MLKITPIDRAHTMFFVPTVSKQLLIRKLTADGSNLVMLSAPERKRFGTYKPFKGIHRRIARQLDRVPTGTITPLKRPKRVPLRRSVTRFGRGPLYR